MADLGAVLELMDSDTGRNQMGLLINLLTPSCGVDINKLHR
jgi:hypothetical protein